MTTTQIASSRAHVRWLPVALTILLGCAASEAFAQVSLVLIDKENIDDQVSASTTQPPGNGVPYDINAQVAGSNLDPTANGFPAPTITPYGTAGSGNFTYDPSSGTWYFGGTSNGFRFSSQSALDAAFPNGSYAVSVAGTVYSLDVTGNLYPNAPVLTLTGGTWTNGEYVVPAGQQVTISTNAFTNYGTDINDAISINAGSYGHALQFATGSVPGFATSSTDTLSLTIPAGQLLAGQVFEVDATFFAFNTFDPDPTEGSAIANALIASGYTTTTRFDLAVSAVPLPAGAGLLLSGLGAVAAMARRRRDLASTS